MITWLKNAGRIAGALLALPSLLACYAQIKAVVYEVEDPKIPGPQKKVDAISAITLALNALGNAFGVTMPTALIVSFADPAIDLVVAWENARGNMPHVATAAALSVPTHVTAAVAPAPCPTSTVNTWGGPVADPKGVITQAPPNPMNVA